MMKSKPWRIARNAVLIVALLGSSLWLWAHFTREAIAARDAAAEAKAIEEANKRYPVKGRRTDLGESSSLPSTGAPPLDTIDRGTKPERPRMRIIRGKDE